MCLAPGNVSGTQPVGGFVVCRTVSIAFTPFPKPHGVRSGRKSQRKAIMALQCMAFSHRFLERISLKSTLSHEIGIATCNLLCIGRHLTHEIQVASIRLPGQRGQQ